MSVDLYTEDVCISLSVNYTCFFGTIYKNSTNHVKTDFVTLNGFLCGISF